MCSIPYYLYTRLNVTFQVVCLCVSFLFLYVLGVGFVDFFNFLEAWHWPDGFSKTRSSFIQYVTSQLITYEKDIISSCILIIPAVQIYLGLVVSSCARVTRCTTNKSLSISWTFDPHSWRKDISACSGVFALATKIACLTWNAFTWSHRCSGLTFHAGLSHKITFCKSVPRRSKSMSSCHLHTLCLEA